MAIDVSSKLNKIARNYKLTPEQLAFADLVTQGWPEEDAWAITIRTGAATWNRTAYKAEVAKLLALDAVQQRIAENKKLLNQNQVERIQQDMKDHADELLELATNKEKKLIELQTILKDLKPGSTEYNKVNDQIINISRMKQNEVKTDDKTIHYYLPVSYPTGCQDCLYSRCDQCKFKRDKE
jgi:hypothetical protein